MSKAFQTILTSAVIAVVTAFTVVRACAPKTQDQVVTNLDGSMYRTVNLSQDDVFPDLTYAAESAVDAVVYVKVTVKSDYSQMDPFLRYFFGFDGPSEQQGSGSGVIIRPDGYIVTNNHVVANATKVEVTLNNNKSYEATVIGKDPVTDVALVKIDAEGLPTVTFGDSDKLRLGEWVLAIGSPLGEQLKGTITAGIVSAKGRSMQNEREFKIESFIQTDAAVNPGNSGGALVNKSGELVGINTAIISQTGAYSGYSFAIPSNMVKAIVEDLIDFGSVRRAVLGITMSPVTEEIAKDLKLSSLSGVYINEVSKSSAADKAGLKKGDVIVSINSDMVKGPVDVQAKVGSFHPGDKAVVTVVRDGKKHDFEVTFQASAEQTGTVAEDGSVAFYGARLKTPEKGTLEALGLKSGVEIVSLGPGKVLNAGGSEGFIIQFVNDEPVSKPEDVINIAKKAKRSIFIQGVTASGRESYFGFGKD